MASAASRSVAEMGVDVERRRRPGMAEWAAHRLHRDAGVEETGGGEMAGIVQSNGLVKSDPLAQPPPGACPAFSWIARVRLSMRL